METKFFRGFDCTITFADIKPTGFNQVFEWLKSGKKIRNVSWEKSKYIHIVQDQLVNQDGKLVENICFNIVWEVVQPITLKDLKPGQKFTFNSVGSKKICTKLFGNYYHCPEYQIYQCTFLDTEVTLA